MRDKSLGKAAAPPADVINISNASYLDPRSDMDSPLTTPLTQTSHIDENNSPFGWVGQMASLIEAAIDIRLKDEIIPNQEAL